MCQVHGLSFRAIKSLGECIQIICTHFDGFPIMIVTSQPFNYLYRNSIFIWNT